TLSLALPDSMRVDSLPMAGGASRGQPQPDVEEDYGRITGLAAVGDGVLLGGTTNKDGGSPVETDDRVGVLPTSGDGGGDARTGPGPPGPRRAGCAASRSAAGGDHEFFHARRVCLAAGGLHDRADDSAGRLDLARA